VIFSNKKRGHRRSAVVILGSVCSVLFLVTANVVVPAAPAARPQAKEWATQMPEGEGKKLIVQRCQLCHSLENVVNSHRSKDDWAALVDMMIENGATLTDSETDTVIDYLAANYGPKSQPMGNAPSPAPASSLLTTTATILDPDQARFTAPPESLGFPVGAQMCAISGDFSKQSSFSFLLKFPVDQRIEPHSQSVDFQVVVLRGVLELGFGPTYDPSKLQAVGAGEIVGLPARSYQFEHAKGEVTVLFYGTGPLSMNWLAKNVHQ